MERYQGKKVVIIGGTSGMGLATARVEKTNLNEPETNPRRGGSCLLSLDPQEFISERQSRKLLHDLNRAYSTPPKRAERRLLQEAKGSACRRLKSEW